jgi:hypothetical protein
LNRGRRCATQITIPGDGCSRKPLFCIQEAVLELQEKNRLFKKPKPLIDNNCVNTLLVQDTLMQNVLFSGYKRFGYNQIDSAEALLDYGIFFRRSTRFSRS